jgi:hypothetical protein
MTNEQIFELAKTCGFDDFTGEKENYWECWEQQLLKFARAIYSEGFSDGCKEGSYSDYTWMRP